MSGTMFRCALEYTKLRIVLEGKEAVLISSLLKLFIYDVDRRIIWQSNECMEGTSFVGG